MKTRLLTITAVCAVVCLMGAIQVESFIGSLRTSDGELLAEKDGRMVLVRDPAGTIPKNDAVQEAGWRISAPYLKTPKGKFLTLDQDEHGVKVRLAEKNDSAKWVIEVTETITAEHPKKGSIDERQMLVGTSKRKFRLIVFEGRFKGWYLSAEKPTESPEKTTLINQPLIRELRVVQDPKQATLFDYVDTNYRIIHK